MSSSRGKAAKDEDHSFFSVWSKETLLDPDGGDKAIAEARKENILPMEKAVSIACCFLSDYEAGRFPSLSSNFHNISDFQLRIYRFQHSFWWRWLGLYPALSFIFMANFPSHIWTAVLHIEAELIFVIDIIMTLHLSTKEWRLHEESQKELYFQKATVAFLVAHGMYSCLRLFNSHAEENSLTALVLSLFKPLLFFYISPRARTALDALIRSGMTMARFLVLELFLILTFAAVACRLYYEEDGFRSLTMSWLSLFQLSTTVVNPSLWMPIYSNGRINAIFFVFFIVVCVFYLHSLTLSVVSQVFIQAATGVHDRTVLNQEKCLRCAYSALSSAQLATESIGQVDVALIRQVLEQVRPHFGPVKVGILMELVNPAKKQSFDFPAFRTAIRDALEAWVRTSTKGASFGNLHSVLVAFTNFLFVTLLTSSSVQAGWMLAIVLFIGSLITLFGIVELMRGDIWSTAYDLTKLNVFFDGFAVIAAITSCYGICIYITGHQGALDYLLTGRALDMVCTLRFFPLFRDIVERSIDVLPALEGPVFLVMTTIHIFVNVGIGLWGGQIDVDDFINNNEKLYFLNNFNSYTEGLVTIFNVLVINDWHEIAKVFLHANHYSHPVIVYTYFVLVVLIAVCIMLNVITAFFVEAFTARFNKDDMENDGVIRLQNGQSIFHISTSMDDRISNFPNRESINHTLIEKTDASMARYQIFPPENQIDFAHVFERQGVDRITQAVAQSTSEKESMAKCLCATLEVFTSVINERRSCEFLVTSRSNLQCSQYQSVGFRQTVAEFLDEYSLQSTIDELTTLFVDYTNASSDVRRRVRQFVHPRLPTTLLDLTVIPVPHVADLWLVTAQSRQIEAANG